MKFIDQIKIYTRAGKGGMGCASFKRTRTIPLGGPDGGNGGRGGDIILQGELSINTLEPLFYRNQLKAEKGKQGSSRNKTGAGGKDLLAKVPLGTVVWDQESGKMVGELLSQGQKLTVAQGGKGGRGNLSFKSNRNRAPKTATQGEEGEAGWLRLELKLMADVGLIGFPNTGKSTLLNSISRAASKVGHYPFTTLTPKLGSVQLPNYRRFTLSDLPGLIKNAHKGTGLGTRFLRHVERNRIFLHLLSLEHEDDDLESNFEAINSEIFTFNPQLAEKPQMVVLNKIDIDMVKEKSQYWQEKFAQRQVKLHLISAKQGLGIDSLKELLGQRLCVK